MLNKNKVYNKLVLYSVSTTQEARLLIQDYKGYPRVTVFLNEKNSRSKSVSKINFAINKQSLYLLRNELSKIIDNDKECEIGVQMFSPVWENDQQTDKKKEVGVLSVGKKKVDDVDVIYFKITNGGDLKFSFKILPSPFVVILKDGKPIDKNDLYKKWSLAYIDMLTSVLDLCLEAEDGNVSRDELTKSKIIKDEDIDKELEDI